MGWRPPKTSGNPNRRHDSKQDEKVIITWKKPDEQYGLGRREVPAKYKDPGIASNSFKAKLEVGAFMVARVNLSKIEKEQPNYPFPTLRECYRRELCVVPKGMSMIYAGTVRVKERMRSNRQTVDMEVPKHTFVIPNVGRCIIHDLNLVSHA